jgi:hypothetical protein
VPADAWLVRSGCWEIGRNFYYRKLRGITWHEAKENPASIAWRFQNFGSVESIAGQLRPWCAWRAIHPEPIDWKDLFYRDQRLGGWLSAIEQSLDMIEGRSIQPANCSAIFDLLLSEEEHIRSTGTLQRKIVELSRTGLDVFPINPPLDKINPKYARRLREWTATLIGESRNMVGL